MILSIISAIGNNNEIGKNNELLWSLPIDMKHFKETTLGCCVIMGQKTFESLGVDSLGNKGKLLPHRKNIILTLDKNFKKDGAIVVNSISELEKFLEKNTSINEEVFVIGGSQIYSLLINKADKLYITHVNEIFPSADTFFPIIEKNRWKIISNYIHKKDEKNQFDCNFVIYERIK